MSADPTSSATVEVSAGGVVVRPSGDGWEVLVILDPYGNWGLPKGHVEGEETLVAAAVREVTEETGLSPTLVGPLVDRIDWFFRSDGDLIHKYCSFFLMKSGEGEPTPQLDEGIRSCEWVSLAEAERRIPYPNTRGVVAQVEALIVEVGW